MHSTEYQVAKKVTRKLNEIYPSTRLDYYVFSITKDGRVLQFMSCAGDDGLPTWELAVIAVAGGGGGILILLAVYKFAFKRKGTYCDKC